MLCWWFWLSSYGVLRGVLHPEGTLPWAPSCADADPVAVTLTCYPVPAMR